MNIRSIFGFSLCAPLLASQIAVGQTIETRPRRLGVETIVQQVEAVALAPSPTETYQPRFDNEAGLDDLVPREGLKLYLEIRSNGFRQLLKAGTALEPLRKLLAKGPLKNASAELTSFAMTNMGALSNARFGLASYGANGALALIEAASEGDAQQLKAGVAKLVADDRAKTEAERFDVILRGRVVVAGPSQTLEAIIGGNLNAISQDPQFVKVRNRFADEPFFAYVDLSDLPRSLTQSDIDRGQAYVTGALAGINNLPWAIAIAGSIDGEVAQLKALTIGPKGSIDVSGAGSSITGTLFGGLFAAAAQGAEADRRIASSFVPPDTDVFIGVRLNWNKLVETFESFASMLGGPSGASRADLFSSMDASLGFSIKKDLIPTLGSEIAIAISGLDEQAPAASRTAAASAAARPRTPRFTVVLSLRDPAKFEKLVGHLFTTTSSSTPVTKTLYRGASINSFKSLSYAVSNGYFIGAGSASAIRRALDIHATGASLASSAEFRSAMPSSPDAAIQAFISSNLTNKFLESITRDPRLASLAPNGTRALSGIGLSMTPDTDGLMIQLRMPANVAWMALGALASSRSSDAVFGRGVPGGVPAEPRQPGQHNGSRTPKMTTEDVRRPYQ